MRRWLMAIMAWLAVALPATAHAAGGIAVTPPFQQLVFSSGGDTPFHITVSNNTGSTQNLTVRAVDFKSLDETGGVAFVGPSESATSPYRLADWIQLSDTTLTLAAGHSQEVRGTLVNSAAVAPGGHYGAVLIGLAPPASNRNGTVVGLKQVAASLLFTIKTGGERYKMKLDSLVGLSKVSWGVPDKIRARFANSGNVHVVPRGVVSVRDPLGRLVAKGALNQESGILLPESKRVYVTPLQRMAMAWLPGRYAVTVQYRYDSNDHMTTQTFHMVVLNGWLLVLVIVVVIATTLLVTWLRRGRGLGYVYRNRQKRR